MKLVTLHDSANLPMYGLQRLLATFAYPQKP